MSNTDKGAPPRLRRLGIGRALGLTLLSVAGPAALAVAGAYYYVTGGRYASTENAYVKSEMIAISPDVSARVVHVAVGENDRLDAGQLLFRLDGEPFRIALASAEARRDAVRQEIEALRASHRQKKAEYRLAESDVEYFRRQFGRQKQLIAKGIVSQSKFDEARRYLMTARERLIAIQMDIGRILAQLDGSPDLPVDDHPRVREAMAARDQAALDLRHVRVFAPAAGQVTNFDLQPGEYVKAGEPVFSIVRTDYVWIRANFKETDLTHLRVGQEAEVRIDAYPDRVRRAVVASISPATGAEFALLPPQNALGNWVKVVQRLPVRLELTGAAADPPLRAGMSVIVDIDTGYERTLPGFVNTALAWIKGGP